MKTTITSLLMLIAFSTVFYGQQKAVATGGYVVGDFHQHTTYTDGSYSMGLMMSKNNKYGLDWWANSEHGGASTYWGALSGLDLDGTVKWSATNQTIKGKTNSGKMWRWQVLTDYSFPDVLTWRKAYPSKLILQGYEMNVPGHEHASVCIIANQFDNTPSVCPLAQFEYMFDSSDADDTNPNSWVKSAQAGHAKAVEAVTWLQANYPTQSWVIPAHPERYIYNGSTGWNINHLRDLNNAAPDVFFGFESLPGHQKAADRGEYKTSRPTLGDGTYGGAGFMCAKVGGLWDAMLSEGRHFWVFANSDCHNNEENGGDFFPGEYQKNYTYVAEKNSAQAVADGLRSGNTFCVMGDLIDQLTFTVNDAVMGATATATANEVTVTIKMHDPLTSNNNRYGTYTNPEINHVDVIVGEYSSKIDPASANYNSADVTSTTKVVKRFGKTAGEVDGSNLTTEAWVEGADGWKEITFTYPVANGKKLYFRLRGTNKTVNETGETDLSGNPLLDPTGLNSGAVAFTDLWFYSNPIFVENNTSTKMAVAESGKFAASIDQNNKQVVVSFANTQNTLVSVTNLSGVVVKSTNAVNQNSVKISVDDMPSGVYLVNANNHSQKIIVR